MTPGFLNSEYVERALGKRDNAGLEGVTDSHAEANLLMKESWYLLLLLGVGGVYLLHKLRLLTFAQSTYLVVLVLALTLSVPWSEVTGSVITGIPASAMSAGLLFVMAREALKERKNRNQK
jgi:hypothetical protein